MIPDVPSDLRVPREIWAWWRYRVPLSLKVLVLLLLAGTVTSVVLERHVSQQVGHFFHDHVMEHVELQARENRLLFHAYLKKQRTTATLLSSHHDLEHYVQSRLADWNRSSTTPTQDGSVDILQNRPHWLPKETHLRALTHARFVALVDGTERVREVYQRDEAPVSGERLARHLPGYLHISGASSIVLIEGIPHLVTTASLISDGRSTDDSSVHMPPLGQPLAYLVLVTPFDDLFLFSFQEELPDKSIIVLIEQEQGRIFATSHPDEIVRTWSPERLAQDYLVVGKAFLDYGFYSESAFKFATLLPRQRIDALSAPLLTVERRQRWTAALIMISVFAIIIFWLSYHLERFIREMNRFGEQRLGLSVGQRQRGDQLEVMKREFRSMAEQILAARQRDETQAAELQEANQALRHSLDVVRQTQVKLVESEKLAALGGLVAGIAHEINTPVGIGVTAASHLELAARECEANFAKNTLKRSDFKAFLTTVQELSAMILSNLNRAADQIRGFKQIAVDQSSEKRRRFALCPYIHQVLLSLRPRLKNTPHQVTVSCPEGIVLDSFPGAISQVLTNLVVNSLIHGFSDVKAGEIRISVHLDETTPDQVTVRFEDNGVGLSDEAQMRIFEPFYTTRRGQGGSGLGMHIVYNLITGPLGGRIVVVDVSQGGVAFEIQLPIHQGKGSEAHE
jgi:signal transduction histidine kinase